MNAAAPSLREHWLPLTALMFGSMAAVVSVPSMGVAVPAIIAAFHIGQERVQWVSSAFMIGLTLTLLATPWLVDRLGMRRSFFVAAALQLAACLGSAASPAFTGIAVARFFEGMAGGILLPLPQIFIVKAFPRDAQGKAMGFFGFGHVFAPALGPTFGGLLVGLFGWRMIFLLAVPLCLAAISTGWRYLPKDERQPEGRARAFDFVGLVLSTVAVLTLLHGIAELKGADRAWGLAWLGAGFVLAALFVIQQLRRQTPLLELRLFKDRAYAIGSFAAFAQMSATYASAYLLPVYAQQVLGTSPLVAGSLLMPMYLGIALISPLAGALVNRASSRLIVGVGTGLMAVSLAMVAMPLAGATALSLAVFATLSRLGIGFSTPAMNLVSLAHLPPKDVSQGAGIQSFLRQLGGALGTAAIAVLLDTRLTALGAGATGHPLAPYTEAFVVMAVPVGIAALACWFLPRGR